MKDTDLKAFMHKLEYHFSDQGLIEEAFRHSSYVNEQVGETFRDNERFEFLGDAVINLIVGHILMERFPDINEGELSRMRANLVNETQLAGIARMIDVGPYIKLGKGELQTNGREKNSILADTFEAVIAAVYLDGGFDAAFAVIDTHLAALLDAIDTPYAKQDYKSQLQEHIQVTQRQIPVYSVIYENGPDHDKTFGRQLVVRDLKTEGTGKSKKLAEQDAARKALKFLRSEQL
jgi:ribonuclease-3